MRGNPMKTYIALFRGINVVGSHLLPMAELEKILEAMGCERVRTYIRSGNAVFRSRGEREPIAWRIEEEVSARYGFAPKVLLLEPAELQEAAMNNPFPTGEGKALHLFFLETVPTAPDLARLAAVRAGAEAFSLHGRVFYLYAPDGVGRSKLAARVEQCLGVPATARNWNTVRKLLAMAGEESA